VLGGLLALAAFLRVYALTFGMPQFVRPDEMFIAASQYLLLMGETEHIQYWYPTLFHRTVFVAVGGAYLVSRLTGQSMNPDDFMENGPVADSDVYLLARLFSALFGTLTLLPTYWLARRAAGSPAGGLFAAGLLAVAYLPVRDGHFGVTDQLATFTAVLALAAFVRYQGSHTTRDALLAGVALGVAFSSKFTNLTLLPLLLTAHFWGCPPARRWGRNLWLALLVAAPLSSFLAAPEVYRHADRVLFFMRWQSRNNAYFGEGLPVGWVYFTAFTLRYGVGVPLTLAALAGAVRAARRWRHSPAAALTLGFFLIHFGAHGAFRGVFSRHLNPAMPALCVLAALGIVWAAEAARRRAGERAAAVAAVLLTGVCVGPNLVSVAGMSRLLARRDTRVLASEWVYRNLPPDVKVVVAEGVLFALADRETVPLPSANKNFDPKRLGMPTTLAEVRERGARYAITAEYVGGIRYDTRPDLLREIKSDPRAVQVARFSPFSPPDARPTPVLEPHDAWYVPFVGFDGVERPGPLLTIYRLD
jgi:hypothetical protein